MKYLETDVRMTKDKKIIVCHDENLLRTCGVNKLVMETNYADLPKFKDRVPLHFSKNEVYTRKPVDQDSYSLLEDVLKAIPKDVVLQVDLKDKGNMEVKKEVIKLIHKYDRKQTTVIGSEFEADNLELREIDPTIPNFLSAEELIRV